MNIGELEQNTGLSKANIRFYEKEGLLSPKRSNNQYREYTEEDIVSLKKILLLRQLQVAIPIIKQIIDGEVLLMDVMQEQNRRIMVEQEKNGMASLLIGRILQDGVTYKDLDVELYKQEMNIRTKQGHVEGDVLLPLGHPWRRFLSRSFDFSLYTLLWQALLHLQFRINFDIDLFTTTLQSLACIALMMTIEPMLLSTLGTTPGKWLFGLVIRDKEGNKPTYAMAFRRTWVVASSGLGYGLPVYVLYCGYRCFVACQNQEEMPWEVGMNTIKDTKWIRYVGWSIGMIVVLFLAILIPLQAIMPKHRGDLTPERYYANANDIMNYLDIAYGKNLSAEGRWIKYSSDGTGTHYTDQQMHPMHQLTIEDGVVVGVTLVFDNITGFKTYVDQKAIALISFLGSSRQMNAWKLSSALSRINQGYIPFSFDMAGIRVKNDVTQTGYEAYEDLLLPVQGQEQTLQMVFSLEKIKQ